MCSVLRLQWRDHPLEALTGYLRVGAGLRVLTKEQEAAYTYRPPGTRGRRPMVRKTLSYLDGQIRELGTALALPWASVKPLIARLSRLRLDRREWGHQASPITYDTYQLILRAAALEGRPMYAAMAALMWHAALRGDDLLKLQPRKGDVTFLGSRWVRLRFFGTKEAKKRGLPSALTYELPLELMPAVRSLLRGAVPRRAFVSLMLWCQRLVPDVTWHSWKRGSLQHLARCDLPWAALRVMARHQHEKTTMIYLFGGYSPDMRLSVVASTLLAAPPTLQAPWAC
eukprot:TRINITY_DN1887_c1_g1_i3.p2 TRINITY_DN1887_c1_g1~~TRINITY_DN1887_c1_g1_i3.p2  ORF type:complete len:284 (+),score=13.69 TRINITY_DN1887_c1_g1_i3:274-1125(+)